jgi:acyl dehydratase
MTITALGDVGFGEELPAFIPDTSLETGKKFADLVGWDGARFSDHEAARKEGFPGAIIPGILSQGYLVAMIHNWAPCAEIKAVDTVFRAPVVADQPHTITGVVTDINEEECTVEIDLTVSNDQGETRVFGTASVSLPA